MARTWLSIRVDLVGGRGEYPWPRPGRLLLVRRTFTFRQLAEAINAAFGRWDLSHLHHFVLADGTQVIPFAWWDEPPAGAIDDSTTRLSRLGLGEQFAYEFDLGDGWEHLCSVDSQRVDPEAVYGPHAVYGTEPLQPTVYFGWGTLPDQYGREWADEDDAALRPPEPPTSDLPPLMPGWGAQSSDWARQAPDGISPLPMDGIEEGPRDDG